MRIISVSHQVTEVAGSCKFRNPKFLGDEDICSTAKDPEVANTGNCTIQGLMWSLAMYPSREKIGHIADGLQ